MLRFTPARPLLGCPPHVPWKNCNVASSTQHAGLTFSSPSPIPNPQLQQRCQRVHSLRPPLGKLEAASQPPPVISGVTPRARGVQGASPCLWASGVSPGSQSRCGLSGICVSAWSRFPKLGSVDAAAGLWKLGGLPCGPSGACGGWADPVPPGSSEHRLPSQAAAVGRTVEADELLHPPAGSVCVRGAPLLAPGGNSPDNDQIGRAHV